MAPRGFPGQRRNWPAALEWSVAGLLTLGAVILQLVNFRHAGGLWRDEVAAVNLAQMPSWSAIWEHLEHESFPLLITLVFRTWSNLGFGSTDVALRSLGLLISVALLAAIWWSTWALAKRPPLFALLLIALSPVAVRWGGSLRAYGLGVLLAVLAIAAVWRVVERRTWGRVTTALVVGVLAVQALYQNALVIFAVGLSAMALAAGRRDWKLAGTLAALCSTAAVSMVPYAGVVRRASEWNLATQVPIDLERIWVVLHRALAASGNWMPWLWGVAVVAALALAIVRLLPRKSEAERAATQLTIYLTGTAILTTVGYFAFLKVTKFPTEEWYYLLWMTVTALALDVLISRAPTFRASLLRPIVALVAGAFAFSTGVAAVQVRATNVDLIANRLNSAVAADDVVVVQPWFNGVSLGRYYSGAADLVTLPPVADRKLQRLDLFKEQIAQENALAPVLQKIEETLRAGATVWLIGHYPFSNPPQPAPVLPRGGEGPEGWRGAPYMAAYGMEVAYFIQMHALRSSRVEVPSEDKVHPFEDLPVRTVAGWRPTRGFR